MANIQSNYTTNIAITITLASLTTGSFATSNAIDNSSNKYIAADIQLTVKTGASGVSATGYVSVFLIRSADGTTFDDGNNNAQLLGNFNTTANATTYIFSIDTTPFGQLPTQWKLLVQNNSGGTFDTTEGNFAKIFSGKKFETA